jgi:hypothetical protein
MLNTIDLKQIERKAFRSTYEDGLMDIYLGVIVAASGIFMHRPESGYSAINIIVMLLIFAVLQGLYQAGKKYITLPRMGQVRFGPLRRQKKRSMAIILGIIVLVQAFLVGLTFIGWMSEKLFASFGDYNSERLAVAALASLFVGPPMLVMAFLNDYPRGYYIAVLMALAVFLMILTNQPIYTLVIGGLIIVPGMMLFVRFLRKYPIPQGGEVNG